MHVDWTLSLRGLLVEWRRIHWGGILGELDTPIAGHWWGLRIGSTLLLDTSMERCGANSLLLAVMLLRVLSLSLRHRLLRRHLALLLCLGLHRWHGGRCRLVD